MCVTFKLPKAESDSGATQVSDLWELKVPGNNSTLLETFISYYDKKHYLVICLPRHDRSSENRPKNKSHVKNIQPISLVDDVRKPIAKYELISVVIHSGESMDSGYYYCYARHSQLPSDGNQEEVKQNSAEMWYKFADHQVTQAIFPKDAVKQSNLETVSLLIYRKLDGKEVAVQKTSSPASLLVRIDQDNQRYLQVRSS